MNIFYAKQIIPVEFCHFLTHILLRKSEETCEFNKGDGQVPTAKTILHREYIFETLQERLWPLIENICGEELLPTYSYSRLYSNGDELKSHIDRPTCEVSISIQLGRSHNYSWPLYIEGKRIELAEGDGVIYFGYEQEHWRNVCEGPENYYSGQVFMHFVKKHGKFSRLFGDPENRVPPSFEKNRTFIMETKCCI